MSKKISELTAATTPLGGTETVEIVQGGTSKKVAVSYLGGSSGGRELLSSNRTYYVRTDGSDSNNGLANTSGGAFLTIQKAVNVISSTLELNGYDVTVQLGDGTYTAGASMRQVVGADSTSQSKITIVGNTSTPSNVIVSTTSANCFNNSIAGTRLDITYLKVQTTTSGSALFSSAGGRLFFNKIVFGTCANFHISSDVQGIITASGDYSISGAAQYHMTAAYGGYIQVANRTVTITGTPAFTVFANASQSASLYTYGSTYSGSATGTRYSIVTNATCFTNAGGANYFPGNVAGTTATGGQYT